MLKKGLPCLIKLFDTTVNNTDLTIYMLNCIVNTSYLKNKKPAIDSLMKDLTKLTTYQCAQLLECTHSLCNYNYDTLIISELETRAQRADQQTLWQGQASLTAKADWRGSTIYTTATVINALSQAAKDNILLPEAIRWLQNQNDGEKWISTAITAEAVRAIGNFYGKINNNTSMQATPLITINGYSILPQNSAGKSDLFPDQVYSVPDSILNALNTIKIRLTNSEQLFCFASLCYSAHPSYLPIEQYPLILNREYYRIDYQIEKERRIIPLSNTCHSGDELEIHLQVKSSKSLKYICIEDYLPAGFEPVIPKNNKPPLGCIHAEYHPDKCLFYISDLQAGSNTISYRCQAVFPGEYRVNPALIQAMYYPEIKGYSKSQLMRIKK
ncbi:MAG: hypothetical protein GX660_06295 [Clostridiaceae bacterium]|nr:hypothetical protein [Clostridiaceae bacterium]